MTDAGLTLPATMLMVDLSGRTTGHRMRLQVLQDVDDDLVGGREDHVHVDLWSTENFESSRYDEKASTAAPWSSPTSGRMNGPSRDQVAR